MLQLTLFISSNNWKTYFSCKFIVTQRFFATVILLRPLKQVFWKKTVFYVHYLHNNIAMLLITNVKLLFNFIFENVFLHSFILYECSIFFLIKKKFQSAKITNQNHGVPNTYKNNEYMNIIKFVKMKLDRKYRKRRKTKDCFSKRVGRKWTFATTRIEQNVDHTWIMRKIQFRSSFNCLQLYPGCSVIWNIRRWQFLLFTPLMSCT